MDHGLELISPILKILEIEVSNILYNPGNIGKLIFSNVPYPGNLGNLRFSIFSYSGNIGKLIFSSFYYPGNIWRIVFSCFLRSWKY